MSSPETMADIRNAELYIQVDKEVTKRENALDSLVFKFNRIYLQDLSVKHYEIPEKNQ